MISIKLDKYNKFVGIIKAEPENLPFFENMNPQAPFLKMDGKFVLYDIVQNYQGRLVASNVRLL